MIARQVARREAVRGAGARGSEPRPIDHLGDAARYAREPAEQAVGAAG